MNKNGEKNNESHHLYKDNGLYKDNLLIGA
jgi:hypothetical protein